MKRLFIIGLIMLSLGYVLDFVTPYDDTDPPGGRSGVTLITDHATGCQYLRQDFSDRSRRALALT